MKKIIVCLLVWLITTAVYSQVDTCLSKVQLVKVATTLIELKVKDSIQEKQIYSLNGIVTKYEILQKYLNEKIDLQDKQLVLYKESILSLKDIIYIHKPKWYETQTANMIFGFVLGGTVIYTSSIIINNIK